MAGRERTPGNFMSFRSLIAAPAYGALRTGRALSGSADPAGSFRALIFHGVTERQADAFIRLLDFIENRFGFLTPEDAAGQLDGSAAIGELKAGTCLLTFDDGFLSNHEIVAPILERKGVSALFFVCPGLVDLQPSEREDAVRRAMFRSSPPPEVEPLMGWDRIAELRQAGHTIGAHSIDHRRLAGLGAADLAAAIGPDGDRIEQETGRRPDWFAFPFGDIDSVDQAALAKIGRHYRYCRSGVRGLNVAGKSPLAVCADHVDLDQNFSWHKLAVAGGLWRRYAARRKVLQKYARDAAQSATP